MIKLLSIISIILAIILFPPATLALVSNNAVPGDLTYPIKRTLENGIYAVASLNPTTKAWFAAARSDRRFQEFSALIGQGKFETNTLNELVAQTDIAASEIKKIDDPVKKQQLIAQLSESIKKYDQGLSDTSQKLQPAAPTFSPQPTSSPISTMPQSPSPMPMLTEPAKPSPTPSPTHKATAEPVQPKSDEREKIEEARKKLEEIDKKLKKEIQKSSQEFEEREHKKESDKEKREEDKKNKEDGSQGRKR